MKKREIEWRRKSYVEKPNCSRKVFHWEGPAGPCGAAPLLQAGFSYGDLYPSPFSYISYVLKFELAPNQT